MTLLRPEPLPATPHAYTVLLGALTRVLRRLPKRRPKAPIRVWTAWVRNPTNGDRIAVAIRTDDSRHVPQQALYAAIYACPEWEAVAVEMDTLTDLGEAKR